MNIARSITRCALALSALSMLSGCPGGGGGVARPATSASGGSFSVTVNPVGPPKWTYSLATTGSSNINAIELESAIDPADCTLTPPATPAAWATSGLRMTDAAGSTNPKFSVECDKTNGPVYIKVRDVSGTVDTTLGPVAGPT
jgi:hypothetical protein